MNNAPLDAEHPSAIESTPPKQTLSADASASGETSPSAGTEADPSGMETSVPTQPETLLSEQPASSRQSEQSWPDEVREESPSPTEDSVSSPETTGHRPGVAARCFTGLSFAGPLVLLVLWAIQAIPNLPGREPRALHELAAGLQTCYLGVDPWLAEQLASHPMSDMTPVYTWFLKGLSLIPGLDGLLSAIPCVIPAGAAGISPYPELLPLGTALASLFLVLLTWCLARATGNDRKTAFASGLVLLAGLAWMGLPCLAGDELLGAALMTLTSICLYRGWRKDFAPLWLLCGFALVAVSTLAVGLPGLVFPLLTSLFFLIWRGTFRRAGARDGALAFGVMLILLCAWGTLIAFSDGGRELLRTELEAQFLAPILYGLELQGRDSWIIPATLALIWLPWTLLILFLPWERIGGFLRRIGSNRRERPGQGWLWCSLLVGLIVFALLGAVSPLLLPPLLPPLAVLTAQGLLSIGERRSRAFFLLLAILLALLGLFYAVVAFYPLISTLPPALVAVRPVPLPLAEAAIPVAGFILFALLLWKAVDRTRSDGSLLVFTILALLLAAPLACLTEHPAAPLPASRDSSPIQAEPNSSEDSQPSDMNSKVDTLPEQSAVSEDTTEPPAITDTAPVALPDEKPAEPLTPAAPAPSEEKLPSPIQSSVPAQEVPASPVPQPATPDTPEAQAISTR